MFKGFSDLLLYKEALAATGFTIIKTDELEELRASLTAAQATIESARKVIDATEHSEDGHCPLCGAIFEHTKDCPIGKWLTANPAPTESVKP